MSAKKGSVGPRSPSANSEFAETAEDTCVRVTVFVQYENEEN